MFLRVAYPPSDSDYLIFSQELSKAKIIKLDIKPLVIVLLATYNKLITFLSIYIHQSKGKKHVGESSTSQQKANKQSKCFRRTVEQVRQLKEIFKKCPHPDKDQLIQIGKEVGFNPKKIKTWFYNKTQTKTQIEISNKTLRTENARFRYENIAMKEEMKKIICPQCDSERASNLVNLKSENQRLIDEILWYSILLGREDF
ncbi:hypothetical protein KY289_020229 [Solanum tuberosum]|nr:hypothetical protein KY289_020229 [Solanum tuberosum]